MNLKSTSVKTISSSSAPIIRPLSYRAFLRYRHLDADIKLFQYLHLIFLNLTFIKYARFGIKSSFVFILHLLKGVPWIFIRNHAIRITRSKIIRIYILYYLICESPIGVRISSHKCM